MGKIVCQYYDNGICHNEDCLEECSFQSGHFEKCFFAKLVDQDVLEAEWMSDNYNSDGSVRQ